MLETNKIYNIDCIEGLKQLDSNCIDLILTDPPYNLRMPYSKKDQTLPNDISVTGKKIFIRDDKELYRNWSEKWFNEAKRVAKLIVFTSGRMNFNIWLEIEQPDWVCIWNCKNTLTRSATLNGYACWEPILVYGKPKKRIMCDVFEQPILIQKGIGNHIHPKPLPLISDLVESFSCKNDIVLDPFMGSGTTAVACKKLRRNFIGFDTNPDYVKNAKERIANTFVIKEDFGGYFK
jgi:DNA modification methylase